MAPETERDPNELILQTWASCKARPNPVKLYRSDTEEKARREQLKWRKRISFVELDCGDDSFFVANTYKSIGIADGVAGWRDEGYDPSAFANTLMKNAKHFCETHRTIANPETILINAFGRLKHDKDVVGSSTATCASIVDQVGQEATLAIANLGNNGALVVRNREVVDRAHEKSHGINLPFQLAVVPPNFPHDCQQDSVHDSVRESFKVQEGDVVVLGTDGLFENRFPSEIAAQAGWVGTVHKSAYDSIPLVGGVLKAAFGPDHRMEYTDPYRVTQRVVTEAFQAATSRHSTTPWSAMLKQFDIDHEGGKMDDITVLVARVTTRGKAERTSMW